MIPITGARATVVTLPPAKSGGDREAESQNMCSDLLRVILKIFKKVKTIKENTSIKKPGN